ncbi:MULTISPECIES: hypothetical protein [Nocardiaceae]|uniref:hypothetical protein n=1 Tax=Nocardiaceae TaxID=85025 RepID=UPI000AD0CA0C|nr:hypothetical protein [Rhodococcus fascians]
MSIDNNAPAAPFGTSGAAIATSFPSASVSMPRILLAFLIGHDVVTVISTILGAPAGCSALADE